MTDGELEERLWQAFESQAGALGLPFDDFTEDAVRLAIRQGVARMVEEQRTADVDLEQAALNLRRFVLEMAEDVRLHGRSALDEAGFSQAQFRLCPGLWPFC